MVNDEETRPLVINSLESIVIEKNKSESLITFSSFQCCACPEHRYPVSVL